MQPGKRKKSDRNPLDKRSTETKRFAKQKPDIKIDVPAKPVPKKPEPLPGEEMRLNRFLAHAGICSRRKAGDYIESGMVKVNDEIIREIGHRVMPDDVVRYQDKVIRPIRHMQYILMNKPKNTITTVNDEKGRKTVLDIIKNKVNTRVFPVGRLDRDTTGLLLLTNDGEMALKLTHPSGKVNKVYHAWLDKPVSPEHIEAIATGFELDDGPFKVDAVGYVKQGAKDEVGLELHIGRNRIVRRIFEKLGYTVVKLDRVYFAGLTKKDLPRGRFRHLTPQEVIMLKHFVK